MGMYDYINGEQVKCFYWINWYDGEVCHSGGMLNGYNTGDKVDWKTGYYNYGKNFLVIDDCNELDCDFVAHKIVDGVVVGSYYAGKDSMMELFDNIEEVITYRGQSVDIKSTKDIYSYFRETDKYQSQRQSIMNDCFKEFNDKYERLNVDNLKKNGSIEDGLNLHKKCLKLFDEKICSSDKAFREKWFMGDIFAKEKKFGQFLQILADEELDEKTKSDVNRKLKNMIEDNPDIVDKYKIYMDRV